MNIAASTIYIWQLADKLQASLGSSMIAACVISIISIFVYFASLDTGEAKLTALSIKTFKCSFVSFLVLGCIQPLIPSSKTVAMMVVIPKIADSKIIQQDLPELYNAALEALKSSLNPK